MKYSLAAIGLAPILLTQGVYVRLVTPKLHEPGGARCGAGGKGKSLRLFILGDSAAAGVGSDTQSSALSGQLVSKLSSHYCLSWKLMAKTGHRSLDVIHHAESTDPEIFDVAVVSVGVNDVIGGTALKKWRGLLGRLYELLRLKFGIQIVLLSSIPPMHAFPALPNPLRWYVGKRAMFFNRAMKNFTEMIDGCEFVQPSFPLTKEFIASDGFHPSPAAYNIWAEVMAGVIRQKWQ